MASAVSQRQSWQAIWAFLALVVVECAFVVGWPLHPPTASAPHSPDLTGYDTVPCPDTVAQLSGRRPDSLWAAIDAHALASTPADEANIPHLAGYLMSGARDDWEVVRAIFRWLADRIRYDDAAFNSGHYGLRDSSNLLLLRRGVCDDYAKVFTALAEQACIPSKRIIGFSKGFPALQSKNSLEPDHAWNAFYVDGAWHLCDVTWAASYGQMHGGMLQSTQKFEPYWFDTAPEEFIFMHLPSESRWQLLDSTLTAADFECLPQLSHEYFKLGYPASALLDSMRQGVTPDLARVYMHPFHVQVLDAPTTRELARGDSLQMRFICPDCASMSVQMGGRFTDFERCDSLYCLDFAPRKGTVRLFGRKQRYGLRYDGIMEWVGR
jgi:Transglutaminase-like superfamily